MPTSRSFYAAVGGEELKMGRVDVVNEIHRNKDFFSEKWIEFCQWVEDYGEHVEKCMNDPQLRIDTKKIMQFNSKCRELYRQSNELAHKFNEATRKGDHIAAKRCVKLMHKKEAELAKLKPQPQPPEPDYVRHNYTNFHHLNISGGHVFWIKPGPVNPLLWFALFGNAGNQREPNDKERLIIDCIILTVVHDYGGDLDYSEETITDRFNPYSRRYFKRDNFCWALLDKLNQSDGEGRIQRAFEHVKADLNEQADKPPKKSFSGIQSIQQVISELERWERKYLPDNPDAGKTELLGIVGDRPLESVVSWLEWNDHNLEANKVKAEYTKIVRWIQTGSGVLSKNPDDNPFEADEKIFYLKLKNVLLDILGNIKADLVVEKPAKTKQKTKKTKKTKKLEKRFKHWTDSSDACFLIENNRTQFHYNGNIKDLRLKHGSRTDELLKWLQSGPSSSQVIKEKLCSEGTRPSDLAAYANKTLNDKIAKVGFVGIPQDVEFIKYSKLTNDYESVLKIFTSREELERHQLQQPLVDDRSYKERDDAEQEY